ncbi:hypothetical protein CEXT_814411 [Caerostris extrusa]|uniref:Uncharacterized protein n=1 Tax=Caerostris extrusa TaxID=172846 RepID=A0AAV4P323_CAEEX|nr:hypothetical protein CEXT_814411 [Caerostris extrusa]
MDILLGINSKNASGSKLSHLGQVGKLSKSPFGRPSTEIPLSKSTMKERYAKECLAKKKNKDPDDTREEFKDLLQLLQDDETANKLQKTIAGRTRITIQEIHRIELETNLSHMDEFHLASVT